MAFPLMSLNYALTHQLIGWHGHRAYAAMCALALVFNVALNVKLIPSIRHRRRRVGHCRDGTRHHVWVPHGAGTDLTLFEPIEPFEPVEPFEPFEPVEPFIGGAFMIPAHFLQPASATESMSAEELAIARSVLYASLFDYPLTLAQLRQTLIESAQTPSEIQALYARSEALRATIEHRQGFFFPRDRRDLVAERRRREARSQDFPRPSPPPAIGWCARCRMSSWWRCRAAPRT